MVFTLFTLRWVLRFGRISFFQNVGSLSTCRCAVKYYDVDVDLTCGFVRQVLDLSLLERTMMFGSDGSVNLRAYFSPASLAESVGRFRRITFVFCVNGFLKRNALS